MSSDIRWRAAHVFAISFQRKRQRKFHETGKVSFKGLISQSGREGSSRVVQNTWWRSPCWDKPCFVSDELVCIPSLDGIRFLGLDGKGCGEPYLRASLVCFAGPHLMATFHSGRLALWSHFTQKLLCDRKVRCQLPSEMTVCPWRRYALCLLGRKSMLLLTLERDGLGVYQLTLKEVDLREKNGMDLESHCWLPPGDRILVQSTAHGLFFVDSLKGCRSGTSCLRGPKEEVVKCMEAGEDQKVFAGFGSSRIEVVDVSKDTWVVLETIVVLGDVQWISLSPSLESGLITMEDGSVVLRRVKGGPITELVKPLVAQPIGVCPVGDTHCAVVGRDGSIAVLSISDGEPVGSLHIRDDCASLASSPLCGLIVLGSRNGMLYFVSVLSPRFPVVMHLTVPFETSVSCLAFDRRGTLLGAGSANKDGLHVKVYSGRSEFELLIVVPMPGPAIHISFCGPTLVALVRSENRTAVLHRTVLPEDLAQNPAKYRTETSRTFTGDVVSRRIRKATKPTLGYHPKLGLILSFCGKLRTMPLDFPENPDSEESSPLSLKHTNGRVRNLRISPDLLWLGFINKENSIILWMIREDIFIPIDGPVCHFFEFTPSGDGILVGGRRDGIGYFRLGPSIGTEEIIPEWLNFRHFVAIQARNEVRKYEVDYLNTRRHEHSFRESLEKFDAKKQLDLIYFALEKLSFEQKTIPEDEELVLDDDILNTLSGNNIRKYLACGGSGKDKTIQESKVLECCKIVSNSVFTVKSYSVQKLERCLQMPEENDFKFFSREMKFKATEKRLMVLQDIRKHILYKKTEFNRAFDVVYNSLSASEENISDLYHDMETLASSFPSQSDRDLWKVYVQKCKDECSFSEKTPQIDSKGGDSLKTAIESLSAAVDSIRRDLDGKVADLYEKRRECNVSIFALELTAYCVLLYTFAETEVKNLKDRVGREIKSLTTHQRNLDSLFQNVGDLEEEYTHIFDKVFRLEKALERKVVKKVGSEKYSEKLIRSYLLPSSSAPAKSFKEVLSTKHPIQKPFPVDEKVWSVACNSRDRRIRLERFLREFQDISDVRLRLQDMKSFLNAKQNQFSCVSSGLTTLLRRLNEKVHRLLTVDLVVGENSDGYEKGCLRLHGWLIELEALLKRMVYPIEDEFEACSETVEVMKDRLKIARKVFGSIGYRHSDGKIERIEEENIVMFLWSNFTV